MADCADCGDDHKPPCSMEHMRRALIMLSYEICKGDEEADQLEAKLAQVREETIGKCVASVDELYQLYRREEISEPSRGEIVAAIRSSLVFSSETEERGEE